MKIAKGLLALLVFSATVISLSPNKIFASKVIRDPNVVLDLNPPQDAVTMDIYEGDYDPNNTELQFKEIADIYTKYNAYSSVVCSDGESNAIISEYVNYNFEYKTYFYNAEKGEYKLLDVLSPIKVTDCKFENNLVYLVGYKQEKVNGKNVGTHYLNKMNTNAGVIKSVEWYQWEESCPSCGPKSLFVDTNRVFVLADYPGTIIEFTKGLVQKSSIEIPEYKWVNGSADQLRYMWETSNGKTWVSSDLALWEYDSGEFVHEYLRDSNYELDESGIGYLSNRYYGLRKGDEDYFINEYTGTIYTYETTTSGAPEFKVVDKDDKNFTVDMTNNDKVWLVHFSPRYGSMNKALVGYQSETGEMTNLGGKFSGFSKVFEKGFKIEKNLLLADGKLYQIQYGEDVANEKEFTLSSNNGVKVVTVDYYNAGGYFIGSEQFEYELINPEIPQIEAFEYVKNENCETLPYFKWEITNSRDVSEITLVVNEDVRYEIEDLMQNKYEMTDYFEGENTAILEVQTVDGDVYQSEKIAFEMIECWMIDDSSVVDDSEGVVEEGSTPTPGDVLFSSFLADSVGNEALGGDYSAGGSGNFAVDVMKAADLFGSEDVVDSEVDKVGNTGENGKDGEGRMEAGDDNSGEQDDSGAVYVLSGIGGITAVAAGVVVFKLKGSVLGLLR